jgi:outer membrane protein OmpA-like peptidoglycan-associated protein
MMDRTQPPTRGRQRGSAMIEFTVVGPVLTLLSTVILQYSLMFNAKNLVNHASFMAGRAGTMAHADLAAIQAAYARALIPLYGGGRDTAELAEAYAKASADLAGNAKVELLNPTKESFDDWNDADLQAKYGKRAIPNGALASRDPADVKDNSGQNIQDANLIKLKITHGYELKVPLAGTMMQFMMKWSDTGKDPYVTALYDKRRIPIVSYVTLHMQSDAWEPGNPVSVAGLGNNGAPTDPGFTEDPSKEAPKCQTIGCSVMSKAPTAGDPGTSNDPNNPSCPSSTASTSTLPADVLFEFGKSSLTSAGKQQLDQLITTAKSQTFDSVKLTGYTDPLGSAALNDQLSLARAQSVKDYLVANGFPNKPITAEGKGSQDLVKQLSECPASGAEQQVCLAPDRRVVVVFQGAK